MIRIISLILLLDFTRAEHAQEAVDKFVDQLVANLVDDLHHALGADLGYTTLGQPAYLARRFRADPLFSRPDISRVIHLGSRRPHDCGIACAVERDDAQPQDATVQINLNRRHAFASVAGMLGALGAHGTGTALAYGEERLIPERLRTTITTTKPPSKATPKAAAKPSAPKPTPTKPPSKAQTASTTKPPPKAKPTKAPAAAKTPAPANQKPKQVEKKGKEKATTTKTTTPPPPTLEPGFKLGPSTGTSYVQFKDRESKQAGTGKPVSKGADVTINYRIDGRPLPFIRPSAKETKVVKAGSGAIVKGLDTALLGSGKGMPAMNEGGERTVILPAEVAFGKEGSKEFGIKANQAVELIVQVVKVVPGKLIDNKASGKKGLLR